MNLIARFARLLSPYRWEVALACALSFVTAAGLLTIPLVIKQLMGRAISGTGRLDLLSAWLMLGSGLLAIAASSYYAYLLMFRVAHRATATLRSDYVESLLHVNLTFHREHQGGELLGRLIASISDIERFIKFGLLAAVGVVLLFCGGMALIFVLNWKLACVVTLIIPVVSVGLRVLLPRVRHALKEGEAASGAVASHVHELLLGIEVVQAFDAARLELNRFRRRQRELVHVQTHGARFAALLEPLIVSVFVGTILVVLMVGTSLIAAGELETETMIAFLLYTTMLVPQTRNISGVYLGWQYTRHAFQRLDDIIALPRETDTEGAYALHAVHNGKHEGRITFDHVTYSYPHRGRALDDITLAIAAKECVGVVGASGAGKSTLFNLLLRLYRPHTGTICIDGIDIQELTVASVRAAMAVVLQDVLLFDDTVLENVRYGNPGATEADVYAACRAAQAEEFIHHLPNHYHTVVGERGVKLSGGQRQRLAIARALLKNAPILLMDEATSSLDAQTERQLRSAMKSAMQGRTTIVIAHRLATVIDLPRIVVLHKGRILDEGRHDELLERCEEYRALIATQLIPLEQTPQPITPHMTDMTVP